MRESLTNLAYFCSFVSGSPNKVLQFDQSYMRLININTSICKSFSEILEDSVKLYSMLVTLQKATEIFFDQRSHRATKNLVHDRPFNVTYGISEMKGTLLRPAILSTFPLQWLF